MHISFVYFNSLFVSSYYFYCMQSILIDLAYFSLVRTIYHQHLVSLLEQLHNVVLDLVNHDPFQLFIQAFYPHYLSQLLLHPSKTAS